MRVLPTHRVLHREIQLTADPSCGTLRRQLQRVRSRPQQAAAPRSEAQWQRVPSDLPGAVGLHSSHCASPGVSEAKKRELGQALHDGLVEQPRLGERLVQLGQLLPREGGG